MKGRRLRLRRRLRLMTMQDEKYLVNGKPVTAFDLIRAAKSIDDYFAREVIVTTSKAAQILRSEGYSVEEDKAEE